jgi:carbonic anhydrase
MVRKCILVGVLILVLTSVSISQQDYRNLYTSSLTCTMGRLQSPLNLGDTRSSYNSTINTVYFDYKSIQNFYLDWNSEGRILEVQTLNSTDNFGYLGFSRGGVIKQYALKKIQVSYPAEHSIEGNLPMAEVKLVHEKVLGYQSAVDQYRSIPDANKYFTISLLYSSTGNVSDNGFMDQILSTYPLQKSTNSTNNNTNIFSVDLVSYKLFLDRQFYFYEGSFTSIPCDEIVNYLVIKDIFTLSPQSNSILSSAYSKFTNSQANKLQADYYGRKVYRNFILQGESLDSVYVGMNLFLILTLLTLNI